MSNFILNNTAEEVNSSIVKVVNATTSPLDDNPNMVTSGGVKAYVDTQISSLNPRLTAAESDITALQATVNSLNTFATLTLPQTSYYDSRNVTGWVESDPNGYINFDGTTFSLNINNATKAGQYSATLVLTAFDEDGGSDAHSMQFYRNGSLFSGMTISLNNAQNTNGGFRTISWDIQNGDSWYLRMYESPTNTVTTLSSTVIKVSKIT
jgi:hypothetical protein